MPGTRPKICDELEEADLGNLRRTSTDSGEQGLGDGEFRKGSVGAVAWEGDLRLRAGALGRTGDAMDPERSR